MENFDPNKHIEIDGGFMAKGVITEFPAIRKISKGAFRRRLYTSEKVAIKTSTDPVVKVLEDDLLVTSFVDLDFPSLIDGIDYLIAINILTPARKAELLKDGEQHEI